MDICDMVMSRTVANTMIAVADWMLGYHGDDLRATLVAATITAAGIAAMMIGIIYCGG